jgi:hypothetical protein
LTKLLVLLQSQTLEQLGFVLEAGKALIQTSQVIAGGIALLLKQHNAVGTLEFSQIIASLAQFLFQPQQLFGKSGNRVVGGLSAHLLFQIRVFIHACLQEQLRILRIFPRRLERKDSGFG